ncbi:MAG: hypothetical protein NWE98_04790 [Candidatus Bathyarchaeota archaeon]|nr:hypothetical protein [Candidatus Bathyarchaeota archaeon]
MTRADNEELQGTTLDVYLYAIKKGKPIGPRDVMKVINLSSPSVAYRHLQKLEDLGLLQKNEYGEYLLKNRAHVRGFSWLGKRLVPKMWLYSILFLAILILEAVILLIHFSVETYEFKVFFLLLMLVTSLALVVFTVEGILMGRRKHGNRTEG